MKLKKRSKNHLKNTYSDLVQDGHFKFANMLLQVLNGKDVLLNDDDFIAFNETGFLSYVTPFCGYTVRDEGMVLCGIK